MQKIGELIRSIKDSEIFHKHDDLNSKIIK